MASGGLDTTNGITVDDAGNVSVVGFTDAVPPSPYPTTEGALQTTFGGGTPRPVRDQQLPHDAGRLPARGGGRD
jgi:hypothetical protein